MSVYEIVKLVGTCVGLILGAIVFFVLFFRGMAWIDLWVRHKTGAERSRPKSSAKKRRSTLKHSTPQLKTERSNLIQNRTARSQYRNGVIREQLSNRKTGFHAASHDTHPNFEMSSVELHEMDLHRKAIEVDTIAAPESKTPNRIATVHLMSGETIERVSFCSKEKAHKICEGLGFTGIVLENDEGQISVVRDSNIKLVTWKIS